MVPAAITTRGGCIVAEKYIRREAEKLEQRLVELERDMITQQQRTSSLEDKLEKMYPNIAQIEAEERVFEQRRETPEETAARRARHARR